MLDSAALHMSMPLSSVNCHSSSSFSQVVSSLSPLITCVNSSDEAPCYHGHRARMFCSVYEGLSRSRQSIRLFLGYVSETHI